MTAVALTTTASFLASAVEAVATRIRAARVRRAQRIALVTLMDMDAGRLDDLGLNAQDVAEALGAAPPAGRILETRRAARAAGWTREASARA